jgi:hypothetical protein
MMRSSTYYHVHHQGGSLVDEEGRVCFAGVKLQRAKLGVPCSRGLLQAI